MGLNSEWTFSSVLYRNIGLKSEEKASLYKNMGLKVLYYRTWA